jgi:hypothetical protein
MWLVEKSPTVTNWKTVFRSPNEESARAIFARQLEVHSTGKFRLVNPAGRTVEFELARTLFAAA